MAKKNNALLVSKMVALDEVPLFRLIKSDVFRESLEAQSHEKLPNAINSIREIVVDFSKKAKAFIKEKLKSLSKPGSLIIDE